MRPGFIGSGDNHTGRAGAGYKEVARFYNTDTKDTGGGKNPCDPSRYQPLDPTDLGLLDGFSNPASSKDAFYFTGGLVAVHAAGRTRGEIWEALQRKQVYATSGPRISLWFDLVQTGDRRYPMGSEVWSTGIPRFEVTAMGDFKQQPGCPDSTLEALGAERLQHICRSECYFPDDERYRIERLEVVRVTPRISPEENTAALIQAFVRP